MKTWEPWCERGDAPFTTRCSRLLVVGEVLFIQRDSQPFTTSRPLSLLSPFERKNFNSQELTITVRLMFCTHHTHTHRLAKMRPSFAFHQCI